MEAPDLVDSGDLAVLPHLAGEYRRRRPHETVLYQIVQENYRTFVSLREEEGRPLPGFVKREFERFLTCGDLAEGFLRLHCQACGYDRLVAFSCKCRGWWPGCVGRRMNDGAAFLTDRLIGDTPVRQWVLSLPHGVYAAHARLRKLVVPAGEPEKKSCPCAKERPVLLGARASKARPTARVVAGRAGPPPREPPPARPQHPVPGLIPQ